MPLSINVGLSKKASRDYQSTGSSINIVAELDAALLAKPDELQKQIDGLYQQAHDAIDRNAAVPEPTERDAGHDHRRPGYANGNGNGGGYRDDDRNTGRHGRNGGSGGNGNGYARRNGGGGNGGGGGTMTESQRRAILAIAKRGNVDLEYECREMIGAELDDLTLRQASEFIDHLKSMQPAGNGRGNGR